MKNYRKSIAIAVLIFSVLTVSCANQTGTSETSAVSANIAAGVMTASASRTDNPVDGTAASAHIAELKAIQDSQLVELDLPDDAEILLFHGDVIVYDLEENNPDNPELPYRTLYQYNIRTGESVPMDTVFFPNPGTNSTVVSGDMFYFICYTGERREIKEYNLATNESRVIYQWERASIFPYIYQIEDNIILFDISYGDPDPTFTDYTIEVISLTDLSSRLIAAENSQDGSAISCIDVDDRYIYAYCVGDKEDEEGVGRKLIVYDLDGEVAAEYPLDLQEFLWTEGSICNDAVFTMKKVNDYFLFHTVNNRVKILHQTETGLLPVAVPESFDGDERMRMGYWFYVESFSPCDDICLSTWWTDDNPPLYIFSTETGELIPYALPEELDLGRHLYYYMDGGSLLIREMVTDENGDITGMNDYITPY